MFTREQVADNSLWMVSEKIVKLAMNVGIAIWMARYLGPEAFGILNYAIAIVVLFTPLTRAGLDQILVRELVASPESTEELLRAGFTIRLIATVVGVLGVFLLVGLSSNWVFGQKELIVIAVSASLIFQPLDIFEQVFLASYNVKYASISRMLLTGVMATTRILLILSNASLEFFAFALVLESALLSLFLWIAAHIKKIPKIIGTIRMCRIRLLLQQSWPMLLSGFAVVLYLRIDQVMIDHYLGANEVGIYSVALRVSEIWFSVMAVFSASLLPKIVDQSKSPANQLRKLQKLLFFLIWINISFAAAVTFSAEWFLPLIFGTPYSSAASVLSIHVWTGPFVVLGLVSGNWLIAENLQKLAMLRTIIGALVNIFFNIILIPIYGIIGAAIASLIAQITAALLFDSFFRKTHKIFITKLRSFISPGIIK